MTLDAAREAWRDWLKSERRLAAHTLVSYEHDVARFVGFMMLGHHVVFITEL